MEDFFSPVAKWDDSALGLWKCHMVLVPARPPDDPPPPSIWTKHRSLGQDQGGPVRLDFIVMDVVDGLAAIGIGVVVTLAFWMMAAFAGGASSGTTGVLGIVFGGLAIGVMSVPLGFLALIALTVRGVGPGIAAARSFGHGDQETRGWEAARARLLRYVVFVGGIAPVAFAFTDKLSLLAVFILGLPVGGLSVSAFYLDLERDGVRRWYLRLVPPLLLLVVVAALLLR